MSNPPKKVGLAEGARGPDVAGLRSYLASASADSGVVSGTKSAGVPVWT